jgi:hypothetical protein
MTEAEPYLQSDDVVEVVHGDWIMLRPKVRILIPGDPVSRCASSSTLICTAAYERAEAGYLVVIPTMTLKLAVFSPNVGDEVIKRYPDITHWVARWRRSMPIHIPVWSKGWCCGHLIQDRQMIYPIPT